MATSQKNSLSGQNLELSIKPFVLGIKSFATIVILILIVQLLRGPGQSESPDKIIYLMAIFIASK